MAAMDSAFPQFALVKNGGRYSLQLAGAGLENNGPSAMSSWAGHIAAPMQKPPDSMAGVQGAGYGIGGYDPTRLDSSAMTVDIARPGSWSRPQWPGQLDALAPTRVVRQRSTPLLSDPRGPLLPYRDQAPDSPLLLPGSAGGADMEYLGVAAGIAPSAPSSPNPRLPSSPPLESVDKLRGKLLDLGSSFVGFDRVVEEDTFRRRQIEQQRVREVLDGLAHLEQALEVEIRRRIEMSKSTQEGVEKLLSEMCNTIQGRILHRFERLGSSMESLFERCSTLERGIQQLRGELPTKHQVESNALVRNIRDFAQDLENDRKHRLDQDNIFLRLIQESEHSVDRRMEQELEMLDKCCEALEGGIDEFASEEDIPATGKRAQILEATARVRAAIGEEARRRESTDDEVVQAINSYTNALHRSLCKTNT